jgi:hypothetical protein
MGLSPRSTPACRQTGSTVHRFGFLSEVVKVSKIGQVTTLDRAIIFSLPN